MMMLVIANIGAEDHRKRGDFDLRQQDFPNWTFFAPLPARISICRCNLLTPTYPQHAGSIIYQRSAGAELRLQVPVDLLLLVAD
jgi:hypothetical protein